MNVGFYYHIEALVDDEGVARVPAHFGMLVSGIAERAGRVTFYGHSASGAPHADMELPPSTVRFVDLGPKRSAPSRTFHPGPALEKFDPSGDGVDVMVVQGPSPLLPHLLRAARSMPGVALIGGDYGTWSPRSSFPQWRNLLIAGWLRYYRFLQRRATEGIPVLLQNPTLVGTVGSRGPREVVPLSSVSARALADVRPKERRRLEARITTRLVYAGRIVEEKGLLEAVESLRILRDRGYDVCLDLVGWEDPREPMGDRLRMRARSLGLEGRVRLLGYVPAGMPLLKAYASADIFIIPTYGDSVPRSMQEAMAMGLPVVASSVGGIEHSLIDREHALLIPPRDPHALAAAVEELIKDERLASHIADRGRAWATSYTNEVSCDRIVRYLEELVRSGAPSVER
jgi:glycosyltransferase involved in cell wall biosynthesis